MSVRIRRLSGDFYENKLEQERSRANSASRSGIAKSLLEDMTDEESYVTNALVSAVVTDSKSDPSREKVLTGSHSHHSIFAEELTELPDMWSRNFIGLYAQYACVGLIYGTGLTCTTLCYYAFPDAAPNTCANSSNLAFFAWNMKIFYAIGTDSFRPFGLRRVPYMIAGWVGVLALLLVLAIGADKMEASTWIVILMFIQIFVMLSDVPADGYSVELGQMEPPERRGQILATGQMVRFFFTMIGGAIQAFLLNGTTTNAADCPISFESCWSWGLTINQYYLLLFIFTLILALPIFLLKEPAGNAEKFPQHSLKYFLEEVWACLKNLTTFNLIVYVIMISCFTNFVSIANIYMQYEVIQLTNFQAGIDTITSYLAIAGAIWIFKTYLININWRYTNIGTTVISSLLGLLWILVYYNSGGVQNGWFTIFIDLDQNFVAGLSQVLFSMSVIELAKPGLEATTYELIISVSNSAAGVSQIIATQLLTPFKAVDCSEPYFDDDVNYSVTNYCGVDEVYPPSYTGPTSYPNTCVSATTQCFNRTDGPHRYTVYCVVLICVSIVMCLIFTNFLPKNKEQCHEWRRKGELSGDSTTRGYLTLAMCITVVLYGVISAVLLLNEKTACLEWIGGDGC